MTLAALIIVVVAAAAAAGLAYAAALVAERFWRIAYPAYWFAAAGAVVGASTGAIVISGALSTLFSAREQIAVDDVLPYMQEIKAREPVLYERIETSVIRDQYDGLAAAQVRSNAKALVASYVADKALFLPDDLTYELAAALRDELAVMNDNGAYDTCAGRALGRMNGDIDDKLNDELVERNNNNVLRVLATKPNENAPRMPAEEFSQLATSAFADATQRTGVAAEEVDTLLGGTGDPAKTCKLMKAFFDALLAHPVEVAASALRTMGSGARPSGHS